jgi:hypothetical protein
MKLLVWGNIDNGFGASLLGGNGNGTRFDGAALAPAMLLHLY